MNQDTNLALIRSRITELFPRLTELGPGCRLLIDGSHYTEVLMEHPSSKGVWYLSNGKVITKQMIDQGENNYILGRVITLVHIIRLISSYGFTTIEWYEVSFAETLDRAPEWDGHTTQDVLDRLKGLR